MGATMTTFNSALKELYTSDVVENLVYANNPLIALIPKFEGFQGKNLRVPIIIGNPQGRSADFARAQARSLQTSSVIKDFQLTRVKDYGVAVLDTETMEATEGKAGSFLDAAKTEIDGALNGLTRSLAIALYGTGYGDIGRASTTVAVAGATTITLNDADQVTNFELGQELMISATVGSGVTKALGGSGNGLIITAIDRSAGVLTFAFAIDDATNGIPTIAAGDYLFVRGDRDAAASPALLKLCGLSAWLPATAPGSSDSFFGVNRSTDTTRLGGVRYAANGAPVEEAVIELATRIGREGGMPDTLFCNFSKYAELQKALGAKAQYVDLKVNAQIGFRGIEIAGPKGTITVVPDQNCPSDRSFMLQKNTWKLNTLNKAIRIIENDNNMMLRQASADGVEIRMGFKGQLGCSAPGWNGVVVW